MTPERWTILQSVFDRVSELPVEEREQALREACPDEEMEREVRRLLLQLDEARSWLEVPPEAARALRELPSEETPETDRLQTGELVANRFEIVRLLGRGGMGEVYEASDRAAVSGEPGSRIALKTLRAALASNAKAVARFRQELFRARQVTHPHVCRLHEIFTGHDPSSGSPLLFFTMELLEGRNLGDLMAQGRLDPEEVILFIGQVAAGLDAAHLAGVLHRDMKPGNIIVTGDSPARRAVITDFGLAASDRPGAQVTESLVGTPAYMSPEQLRGEPAGKSSDIYSLGLIACEMLFGSRPAVGRELAAKGPAERTWAQAIRRCIDAEPALRFGSASEFADALRKGGPEPQPSRRRSLVAVGGVATAALAAAGLRRFWYGAGREETNRRIPLAVLPVESVQTGSEHLQEAVTDQLIRQFRRLRVFEVPGPSTVRPFAGRPPDAREAAKALGVEWLLSSVLDIQGDRLTLRARLIAATGKPGPWQGQGGVAREELERVTASLAAQAAAALRPSLAQTALPAAAEWHSAEAHDLYLRVRYLWNRRQRGELIEARRLAERSVDLDPDSALAFCGLADVLSVLGDYGHLPPAEVLPLAKQAALRAMSLDSQRAEAHTSFAFATYLNDFDWYNSERSYQRALELDPNLAQTHQWYSGLLVRLQRPEQSLRHAREAIRLDAASLPAHRNLATQLYFLRRYPEAIAQAERVQAMSPGYFGCRELLAESHARLGRSSQALTLAAEMRADRRSQGFSLAHAATTLAILQMNREADAAIRELTSLVTPEHYQPVHLARAYADLGRIAECMHWLEVAYARRDTSLQLLPFHHSFQRVQEDGRFRRFVERLRIIYPPKSDRA